MMMKRRNKPKLFSERPTRSEMQNENESCNYAMRRKVFGTLFILLGISLVWGAFEAFKSDEPTGEIPVIEAQVPVKIRPENPGGVNIPNQDKMVFNEMESDGATEEPGVERLLPPPESPQIDMTKPEDLPLIEESTRQAVPVASKDEAERIVPPSVQPIKIIEKLATPPKAEPVPVKKETVVKATPKKTTTASFKGKGFVIQLASFKDSDVAAKQTKRFQQKYAAALENVTLQSVRADLGKKGIYYRVQGQAMAEKDARGLCAVMKAMKAPCIVIRR